jgi:hypothetical protein
MKKKKLREQHGRMLFQLAQIGSWALTGLDANKDDFLFQQILNCVDSAFSKPKEDNTNFTGITKKSTRPGNRYLQRRKDD